jgi:hypothetical protein
MINEIYGGGGRVEKYNKEYCFDIKRTCYL